MSETPRPGLPDRLYARFGWKVWPTIAGGAWLFATLLIVINTINAVRLLPLPPADVRVLYLWTVVVAVSSVAVAVAITVRFCAPFRRPLTVQDELVAAWQTAVALPARLTLMGAVLGFVWTSPATLVVWSRVYELNAALIAFFAVNTLVVITATTSGFLYLSPVLARPMLADLQSRLGRVPVKQTVTLRARFTLLVPALSLGATAAGAVLAQPSGGGVDIATIIAIAVSACLALVIWTPVVLAFATATLTPLSDLLAAAERIKRGDYSTVVRGGWADELGAVATSLNEAMAGLSERQQMAREVRESRARIVAAGDESRRRIERNIHDGAQQRLVALVLDIRMLESAAPSMSAEELGAAHRQLAESVKDALDELRDLARGLHPAVLTTDGLAPALAQLASRATVPVNVEAPAKRFSEHIETTGYFVVAEALANVAKYANATKASIKVSETDGLVHFSISDDGVGGAVPTVGSGLGGLVDRVAAVGGRLTVESPAGAGTRIVADLPLSGV